MLATGATGAAAAALAVAAESALLLLRRFGARLTRGAFGAFAWLLIATLTRMLGCGVTSFVLFMMMMMMVRFCSVLLWGRYAHPSEIDYVII
jgi:hypothetical protein